MRRTELKLHQRQAIEQNTPTFVIIDEGQQTFSHVVLWNIDFKAIVSDRTGQPFYIIIACSYGSAISSVFVSHNSIPISLSEVNRINLRPTDVVCWKDVKPLGLLFDKDELPQLYELWVKAKRMPPIDTELQDLIYRWSEGYIAVVSAMVTLISVKVSLSETFTLSDLPYIFIITVENSTR